MKHQLHYEQGKLVLVFKKGAGAVAEATRRLNAEGFAVGDNPAEAFAGNRAGFEKRFAGLDARIVTYGETYDIAKHLAPNKHTIVYFSTLG